MFILVISKHLANIFQHFPCALISPKAQTDIHKHQILFCWGCITELNRMRMWLVVTYV